MPDLEPLLNEIILPGILTLAVGVLTWLANAVLAVIKEKTGLEVEALNREALHKAIRTHVEALILKAFGKGEIPDTGDLTNEQVQKLLEPLPALVQETNPGTVSHFAGLTGPVLIRLAIQYLPAIIESLRAMKKGPIRLSSALVQSGPPEQATASTPPANPA